MAEFQEQIVTFEIDEDLTGLRADVAVARLLPDVSRSQVQQQIKRGTITVNGIPFKVSQIMELSDLVEVFQPRAATSHLKPMALELDILHEDDDVIVINKPVGLVVHPGAGHHSATLAEGLLYHMLQSGRPPGPTDRPGIVHRLDKDTSGVMVCAKTVLAHEKLSRQFHDKTNQRSYLALLDGVLSAPHMEIESYLFRDPHNRLRFASMTVENGRKKFAGETIPPSYRWAKSTFDVEAVYEERLTLARVTLHTGRTHQIRVHGTVLGAPVVGDLLYHSRTQLPHTFSDSVRASFEKVSRQMLHAEMLGFVHPRTDVAMSFRAPVPADMAALLEVLATYRLVPDPS